MADEREPDRSARERPAFLGCAVCRLPVAPDGACGCSDAVPSNLTPALHRRAAEAVLAGLAHP